MPSKKKSSGSVSLHLNPNRSVSRSSQRQSLYSSKDSSYGSTSLTPDVKRTTSPLLLSRSYSHSPETKKSIILSSGDENSPAANISPSTPLDDVFEVPEGQQQIYTNSVDKSCDTVISMTSFDKNLRAWSTLGPSTKCDAKTVMVHVKTALLFLFFALSCGFIISNPEVVEEQRQVTVANWRPYESYLQKTGDDAIIKLTIAGPFNETGDTLCETENYKNDTNLVFVSIVLGINQTHTDMCNITVNPQYLKNGIIVKHHKQMKCELRNCKLSITTNMDKPISMEYSYNPITEQADNGIYYATVILLCVYVLIIFELVHRTIAAMLGSFAAIAVLGAIHERPTTEIVIGWIDMETIMLLFGMMILVSIFAETGFFDYSAVKVYQIAKGEVWPLITLLCLFSAVVSAFLDNVTTILLLTPVTIRLCQVLNLDPKQILMAEVIFSNIGGTATAIGDPPNVIIVASTSEQGIDFSTYTIHMMCGIIPTIVGAYGMLRFYYRNEETLKNKDTHEVIELKHEIGLWKRAAARISVATREESVMKVLFLQKAVELENILSRKLHKQSKAKQRDFADTLQELKKRYCITDWLLLIESSFVLVVVILIFFLHSFISSMHIDLGWTAVTGAVWLLVLANISDLESILHKVEWATLLFFAALFVLMEALAELGLIDAIGAFISDIVKNVDQEYRLIAAISIIIWISALASSFIDNIPYTTALVPVLEKISQDSSLDLPLLPLIIALGFGACLGGNGTLIGASANVVCSGIAEQHGYGITFGEFFKIGFPMMIVTTIIAHLYLIVCHVWIGWN